MLFQHFTPLCVSVGSSLTFLMSSRQLISGESPPCTHRNCWLSRAARGRQSKASIQASYTRSEYLILPAASTWWQHKINVRAILTFLTFISNKIKPQKTEILLQLLVSVKSTKVLSEKVELSSSEDSRMGDCLYALSAVSLAQHCRSD